MSLKILSWSDDDDLCQELRMWAEKNGDARVVDRKGLPDQDANTIAAGIGAVAGDFDLILIGSTKLGKDIAARVAAHADASYAADIQSLEGSAGALKVSRFVLSGNSVATYEVKGKLVATAGRGTFFDELEATNVDELAISAESSGVTVLETVGSGESDFDLTAADYVVGVGRGFKAEGDVALAQAVADKLKGGAVGCSRPVAADLKWLGEEHWIGLSGNEIKPKVYFAAGVSGQIQHVAGIRGSKLIVAINTNKDAPIFQVSDYGIVGDLYDVLPKLAELL
ncbi:MAG: electron transfer flavoprotein subunit alpha/FixB family protein [Thermoplasmatota archaeon]